jgi:hypothetical protein
MGCRRDEVRSELYWELQPPRGQMEKRKIP